jgi:hypothetical protein
MTDIDDDPDVMYYRAHISIKDMYALKINERMQKFMDTTMASKETHISNLSKMQLFGPNSNEDEVTQMFNFLKEQYKYQVVSQPLLADFDSKKIANLIYGLKDQSSFWTKESKESLKKKEEGLALLSERLEEHLGEWIGHLGSLENELNYVNYKISEEFQKIRCLTAHYENVSRL